MNWVCKKPWHITRVMIPCKADWNFWIPSSASFAILMRLSVASEILPKTLAMHGITLEHKLLIGLQSIWNGMNEYIMNARWITCTKIGVVQEAGIEKSIFKLSWESSSDIVGRQIEDIPAQGRLSLGPAGGKGYLGGEPGGAEEV